MDSWTLLGDWTLHINEYHYNKLGYPEIGPPISIVDDDVTPPTIDLGWGGNEDHVETTDEFAYIYWTSILITDYESNLKEVVYFVDDEEDYRYRYIGGFPPTFIHDIDFPDAIGTHAIRVEATNADNDRASDSQTAIKTQTVNIIDDDDEPPIIEIISAPTIVWDNESSFYINFTISDYSGINPNTVSVMLDNENNLADLLTLERIEVEVTKSNYIYNLFFNVDHLDIGIHKLNITAWDKDNDRGRVNDDLNNTEIFEFTVKDDDKTNPVITELWTTTPINDSIEFFYIYVNATDKSGIAYAYAVFDGDIYPGVYIDGYYQIKMITPDIFGEYEIPVAVYDTDFDRSLDRGSTMMRIALIYEDDDKDPPEITYVYTGDGTDENPGRIIFSATDASGIVSSTNPIFYVSSKLGTYYFSFTAVDGDQDRPWDELSATLTISITIVDDDTIVPVITYVYDGDGTDGNPGTITFFASDASGIAGEAIITYEVPSELGLHEFTFTAEDADNDRLDDSLSTTLTVSITIVDDDTGHPNVFNLIIHDDILNVFITFDTLDDGSGDDQGISIIKILINGECVSIYFSLDIEVTFDFVIDNNWIMQIGDHQVVIEIWDADDDRDGDILSTIIMESFEGTFLELRDYVVWEIDQLIEEIQNSPEDIWGGPAGNRKNTMINKLTVLKEMILSDTFTAAYEKLLHDIKPKLTGLNTNEYEEEWGNGVFKNPWVEDEEFQEHLRLLINELLTNIQILIENC